MNGFEVIQDAFNKFINLVNVLFDYFSITNIVISLLVVVLGYRFFLVPLFGGARIRQMGSDEVQKKDMKRY